MLTLTRSDLRLCRFEGTGTGRGRAAVFLHGLGGTHRYWTCLLPNLEVSGHRTVLLDLLGFGESPRPWMRYTVDRHVDAVRSAIGAESGITLVGHSMGAVVALAYAARYPSSVSRLVLISLPYFGSVAKAAHWFRRQPGGWIYTNMVATALACVLTRRVVGRALPYLLRNLPREVAEDLVKHNMVSSTSSLWEVLYRHDLHADVARLSPILPVLAIHGSADSTAPLAGARLLAETNSTWELQVLDGVDHHPWLHEPALCLAAIERWLDAWKTIPA